ncbi:MAG: pyruvate kinase [Vallitaleaceae bacterium]|nr:pyruvate kinase [Vallitaleaceae bacterium]
MNKTKIICTLGPASDNEQTFRELVLNGLSVVRLNLSHGDQEHYKTIIEMIKKVRTELNIPVAILMDTRGPEIRTKMFENGKVTLETGHTVTLCNDDFLGTAERFCITYPHLHKNVHIGSTVLIDDGLIELEVTAINGSEVICIVKNGGDVKNRKGINVPNICLDLPALTKKDENDILFGIQEGIDFVAASFIRKASDVEYIRNLLVANGGGHVQIISKIESQEGVDNIDSIISVSDAIMIARGDLGVETPPEHIPLTQKNIIRKCNMAEIPVITATQMLDSMINNPRPTRAEVSDVANAVLDGTDAIMLSGETAAGKYPVEAVRVMKRIAIAAEKTINYDSIFQRIVGTKEKSITNAVSFSSCSAAHQLHAKAIICPTYSGNTAKLISMFRPSVPIIATTSNAQAQRTMMLYWGVIPLLMGQETSSDILFYKSVERTKALGFVKPHDLVVITAGVPLGVAGKTNLMKIQEVD